MILVISLVVYLATFFVYWRVIKTKKRDPKQIKWISLISLCPVILSSVFIFDEIIKIQRIIESGIIVRILVLFALIYVFRIFQEWVNESSDSENVSI